LKRPLQLGFLFPELAPEPFHFATFAMGWLITELFLQRFHLKFKYLVCLDAVHLGRARKLIVVLELWLLMTAVVLVR
jgi:hypothetical protein